MELVKALEKLQAIYEEYGNCEVLKFDTYYLESKPINSIRFITEKDFREDLKHAQCYVDNFKKELNNVIIL